MLLKTVLAPNESDGLEDTEEWNLFDEFLGPDNEQNTNTLAEILKKWRRYKV
jgi:hypothetical protein